MLTALGIITYLTFSETILKDRKRYFDSSARNAAEMVDAYLVRELEVVTHALQPLVQDGRLNRPDPQRMAHIFEHFRKHPVISGVALYDVHGRDLAISYGMVGIGFPTSFHSILINHKLTSFNVGKELFVALPIKADNGSKTDFVILVRFNSSGLETFLKKQAIPDSLLMVFFDSQHIVTVYPGNKEDFTDIQPAELGSVARAKADKLNNRFDVFSYAGSTVSVRLTYLVPKKVMLADVITLKDRVITALLLLGWVSIWIVLLIAHRLAKPIMKLSKASEDIITFSYGEPLDFSPSNDEVGKLAKNLEIMRMKIKELISIDPLTDVYNRRYMMHALEMAVTKSVRTGEELSCIMLDMDHFKSINDKYGHLGGDEVLIALGTLLKSHVRIYDVVARFGGEEFAIILPGVAISEATQTAERIRKAIEALSVNFKGQQISFTISVGVSSLSLIAVKTPDALIDSADIALYTAKNLGRNKVALYSGIESANFNLCQ
jgi:diguanylate cyclase (GGDEF)-like protein